MRAWNKATGEPWAITHNALSNILDIAARQNQSPEVVAAKLGRELQNTRQMTINNGVAVIPVVGALFRYANVFTQVSGASSYELIATDFRDAFADNDVHTIVLNIDSPGGEVNGCCDLAQTIYEARGKKPIIAYASGDVASGAYWIASACDKIVVSKTSSVGSIGVVGVYRDNKDDNSIEIVSSQSPHKRVDITTDDGRTRLQQRIDAMANVFIDAVATYRNISPESVQQRYGGGDVFIGEQAVTQGLADNINTFDNLLAGFQQQTSQPIYSYSQETSTMTEKTSENTVSIDAANLLEKGKVQEHARIQAILTCRAAEHREKLAQHLAFATNMDVELAKQTLASAPTSSSQTTDTTGFQAAMNKLDNPDIVPSSASDNEESEEIDSVVKRIASY